LCNLHSQMQGAKKVSQGDILFFQKRVLLATELCFLLFSCLLNNGSYYDCESVRVLEATIIDEDTGYESCFMWDNRTSNLMLCFWLRFLCDQVSPRESVSR
jgi:hypothetical protein